MPITTLPVSRPPESPAPHMWQLTRRDGTGLFIAGPSGNLLFRIDPSNGMIYPWDKKSGREVAIRLADLVGVSV